jgi:hypothetical protein
VAKLHPACLADFALSAPMGAVETNATVEVIYQTVCGEKSLSVDNFFSYECQPLANAKRRAQAYLGPADSVGADPRC